MNPRSLAGYKAKKYGEGFEQLFEMSCNRADVVCTRIPDGCRTYRDGAGRPQLRRVTSPFDFLLSKAKMGSAVVDVKTTNDTNFRHSLIDPQQLQSLSKCGQAIPAGYVVFFRKSDQVVFFSHHRMAQVRIGESLKPNDGLQLGTSSNFDVELIFKWTDDAKSTEPIYQQRLL